MEGELGCGVKRLSVEVDFRHGGDDKLRHGVAGASGGGASCTRNGLHFGGGGEGDAFDIIGGLRNLVAVGEPWVVNGLIPSGGGHSGNAGMNRKRAARRGVGRNHGEGEGYAREVEGSAARELFWGEISLAVLPMLSIGSSLLVCDTCTGEIRPIAANRTTRPTEWQS